MEAPLQFSVFFLIFIISPLFRNYFLDVPHFVNTSPVLLNVFNAFYSNTACSNYTSYLCSACLFACFLVKHVVYFAVLTSPTLCTFLFLCVCVCVCNCLRFCVYMMYFLTVGRLHVFSRLYDVLCVCF